MFFYFMSAFYVPQDKMSHSQMPNKILVLTLSCSYEDKGQLCRTALVNRRLAG